MVFEMCDLQVLGLTVAVMQRVVMLSAQYATMAEPAQRQGLACFRCTFACVEDLMAGVTPSCCRSPTLTLCNVSLRAYWRARGAIVVWDYKIMTYTPCPSVGRRGYLNNNITAAVRKSASQRDCS